MRLQLTDVERLILSNQYQILALLTKDDHYEHMAASLRDGHALIYQDDFQRLSENMSDEDARYVREVIGMFSDLEASYDKLQDKSGIEERDIRFIGFDGNNEGEYLHFAQDLANRGRFSVTLGKVAANSHMPTTAMYRRQLEEWYRLGKPLYPLSKEAIQQIAAARRHPG